MQPEQQRIMGYFIEEAKEHLNTIEQGLLNLQGMIEDSEMLNEIFRAAHSVKGGAAMLGIDGIQQTAHSLEDYFKVLKEQSIQVDQKLESLFFQGFDILRDLLEQLEDSSGLSDQATAEAKSQAELVFAELKAHLAVLGGQPSVEVPLKQFGPSQPHAERLIPDFPAPESTILSTFQNYVPAQLREMLQLFKQADNLTSRQQLQNICQDLAQSGIQLQLPRWEALVEVACLAIANSENSYAALAPILIKDIKAARDLVLAGRAADIHPSQQLQSLLPPAIPDSEPEQSSTEEATLRQPIPEPDDQPGHNPGDLLGPVDIEIEPPPASLPLIFSPVADSEVEAAALNDLADFFEGALPELEATWEVVDDPDSNSSTSGPIPQDSAGESSTQELEYPTSIETPPITLADSGSVEFTSFFNSDPDSETSDEQQLEEFLANLTPTQVIDSGWELWESPVSAVSSSDDSIAEGLSEESIAVTETELEQLFNERESIEGEEVGESVDILPDQSLLGPEGLEDLLLADLFSTLAESELNAQDEEVQPEGFPALSDEAAAIALDGLLQPNQDLAELSSVEESDLIAPLVSEEVPTETLEVVPLDYLVQSSAELEEIDPALESASLGEPNRVAIPDNLLIDSETGIERLGSDIDNLAQPEPFSSDELTNLALNVPDQASSGVEFEDLEKLLEDPEAAGGTTKTSKSQTPTIQPQKSRRAGDNFAEQTMRVPIKHLDTMGNLVGELVVDRNSLEQNQERLRQSLDNLLYQVQRLTDSSQQMQDLYERSLLESSLLSNPSRSQSLRAHTSNSADAMTAQASHAAGTQLDALEMDHFTGFHTLAQEIIERIVRLREATSDIEFTVEETDQVTRMFRQATTQLQEGLTRSRMIPFSETADRLPRAVRDLALKCGKQANLKIDGRDTLVDKGILERLYDPMTHLVNNTLAHGIELPEERQAMGKPPEGQITVKAFYQGNQTIISVSDDGAGIDPEKVKAKAIEKALISADAATGLSQLEVYNLLFHSGFSTRDQADDLAGRGVGMDVVRTSLDEIRGTITTDSVVGQGTTFTIRLPLTLSITKALCCANNQGRVAFPLDGVEDVIDVLPENIQLDASEHPVIAWRDLHISCRPLSELLIPHRHLGRNVGYSHKSDDSFVPVVVLRSLDSFIAVQVDQVLGEQEIVIKQLTGPVPKPTGVAGVTVLGDGRIMPIADILELMDLATGKLEIGGTLWNSNTLIESPPEQTQPLVLIVDDSITVRELLSMTFNKVGYRVEQARDGQEAWDKLRAGLPCDLILCDVEMPRMDGLELLSRVQQEPMLSDIPIAMLTSRGAVRHRQMATQLGARGYFTKPYLEEALLDGAQRLMNGEVLASKP